MAPRTTPTKAAARTSYASPPKVGGITQKATLKIKLIINGECRPKPNTDVKVQIGSTETPLTEADGEFVCESDTESTFTVVANQFSCDEDGRSYEPTIDNATVTVKPGETKTSTITYKKDPPDLTIKIDGVGISCYPKIEKKEVQLFDGANKELKLTEAAANEFYYDLEGDTKLAVLNVVAKPYSCQDQGTCHNYEPTIERSAIRVSRKCASELTLIYQQGRASIEITPKLGTQYVPDVRFRLFDDKNASGTPVVRVTSRRNPTVSFAHLKSETVTIVVDAPPKLGNQSIELKNPKHHILRVNLAGAGDPVDLSQQYEFIGVAAKVFVQVVEHPYDEPVPGIKVRLVSLNNGTGVEPAPATSNDEGKATFDNVTAGTYSLELATDPASAGGRTWTAYNTPLVTLTASDSEVTTELPLIEEPHIVQGNVFGPDGEPAAFAVVEVRSKPDDTEEPIIVQANGDGYYEWEADHAGTYYLTLAHQNGFVRVSVNSKAKQDLYMTQGGGSGGYHPKPNGSNADRDLTPFPLLVGNVDLSEGTSPTSRSAGGDGQGGGQSAGATVSAAIRDVLGYRTRTTDTKGFIAALQRSFTCVEKTGYKVCEWTPRSYAATIPADLGALTGAQASIFERAKASADAVLPLLDGLGALASDADHEDAEAIKSIVRSRISEIVDELSLEGGPRTQRIDELFERLTGYRPHPSGGIVMFNVNTLSGELRKLGERYRMDRKNVNTIAEEENFTNFLIIVDSVATLFVIWQQARPFFDRDGVDDPATENDAPFLGTQLVLISRQLGVVAETIQECYFTMDSVFLGPAERQTVLLSLEEQGGIVIQAPTSSPAIVPTPKRRTAMLLSELLDWIDRFCTDEGPQLIEEAGTDGVNAFAPTVDRLAKLAKSASQQSKTDPQIPPSFFTQRVQLALTQLASQLTRAARLADAVFERLNLPAVNGNSSDSTQGGWR